ncbi:MAG: T9SS type A sorting domain-containing protein [Ignavibacteriales bacterium]|nr:T9SS type A sorting domain-containing protein [Ignavibacteriales bacterium]
MKPILFNSIFVLVLIFANVSIGAAGDIRSSGLKGYWDADSTWELGIKPNAGDNVIIADNDTVTFNIPKDSNATLMNLTVGANAMFRTSRRIITGLTIFGDLNVSGGGAFKVQNRDTGALAPLDLIHELHIYGNILHNGSVFDMRTGTASTVPSVSTLGSIHVFFEGSANNTVTINGTYTTTNNDFNAITINKTGTGRVVLGNNLYINGGSSSQPNGQPYLTFKRGIVQTGDFAFVHLTRTDTLMRPGSDSSYVLGAMGRGITDSKGGSKPFYIGDEFGYRPVKVYTTTPGTGAGHHIIVRVIHADANTGSSTLNGNIDKISKVRYFKVSYHNVGAGAPTMEVAKMNLSYGLDDGIRGGNYDLRVAYSKDERLNWNGIAELDSHKTNLTRSLLPRSITPDSIRPSFITLNANSTDCFYTALADTNGGLNPLDGTVGGFSPSLKNISFGNVLLCAVKKDSITITNSGTGDITIRSHTEVDSAEFETSPGAPITIPASATQTFYFRFTPGSLGLKNTNILFYHDGPDSPDTLTAEGLAVDPTDISVSLNSKWNMISLPVNVCNDTMLALFPSAKTNAYRYEGGSYKVSTTLQSGVGYWIKLDNAETFTLSGSLIDVNSVPVVSGWNLIGAISKTISLDSVTPVGTTLSSMFFAYDQSYTNADSLRPGKAYWIKADQAGRIEFIGRGLASKSVSAMETLKDLNKLFITDSEGKTQTLYFGNSSTSVNNSVSMFEMPPLPPAGSFDVRFASNRFAEIDGSVLPIQISSAKYPVMISWELKSGSKGNILKVDGREISMNSGESFRIENPDSKLAIKLSIGNQIPKEFVLEQNYPNPFNPVTKISFALPQASVVTLKVFNLLGQEVASLLDQVSMEAGYRNVEFNSQNLPSGIYIYKINVEIATSPDNLTNVKSFTGVRKMTLLK